MTETQKMKYEEMDTLLRDLLGRIEFEMRSTNPNYRGMIADIRHDLSGILNNEPCFLPRCYLYKKYLPKKLFTSSEAAIQGEMKE